MSIKSTCNLLGLLASLVRSKLALSALASAVLLSAACAGGPTSVSSTRHAAPETAPEIVPESVPLAGAERLEVVAAPIPWHGEDPDVRTAGRFRVRAVFELHSPAVRFGGFSGLVIEGDRLLAISDRGHWWTADLRLADDGTLEGLGDAHMGPISHLGGSPVAGREEHDAEDLIAWPRPGDAPDTGDPRARMGYLVSFEVDHRIQRHGLDEHDLDGHGSRTDSEPGVAPSPRQHPLSGPAIEWPTPEHLSDMEENAGLEAMVRLDDGRLLILSEGARDSAGRGLAWVGGPEPASPWHSLTLTLPENLHPTAAALLPSGEVLLLERGWNPIDGVTIRLSTFSVPSATAPPSQRSAPTAAAAGLDPDRAAHRGEPHLGHLVPRGLATLRPPLAVDNMEAMDTARGPAGEVLVYLLSDDNYSPTQRTLLVQLELSAEKPSP